MSIQLKTLVLFTFVLGTLNGLSHAAVLTCDFSTGDATGSLRMSGYKVDNNPIYKGSFRLLVPNESYLEGAFRLSGNPDRAVLRLTHLSSSADGAELKGRSPVTIRINGHVVVRDLDPGSHGYVTDELNVTKYLQDGENTLRIEYGNGTTHYWIKSLELNVQ